MGLVSTKLRRSAKGQPCTLRFDCCNGDTETTVLCHLPSPHKGMGNKADDTHAVFGCHACHEHMDQHRGDPLVIAKAQVRALAETQRHWLQAGLLIAPADPVKSRCLASAKPRAKSKWQSRPIQSRGFPKRAQT